MADYLLVAVVLWIVQGILGFRQMQSFDRRFKLLRRDGRVVVGKAKGKVGAGTVMLFVLDEQACIIRAERMRGISVFARLKNFVQLNGQDLLSLDENQCACLDKSTRKAVLNAVENYRDFVRQNTAKGAERHQLNDAAV